MRGRPVPAIEGPEKPAPSVSSVSRCASGTHLPLATPWRSVNCAISVCTPCAASALARAFFMARAAHARAARSAACRMSIASPNTASLDRQREQEAHHVGVDAAGQQDQPALQRLGLHRLVKSASGSSVPARLNSTATMAPRPRTSAICGTSARRLSSTALSRSPSAWPRSGRRLLGHHVDHRVRRGDGQRVAGIGAAQAAGRGRVHDLGLAGHGRQRHAGGERLGDATSGRARRRSAPSRTSCRCGRSRSGSRRRSARCRARRTARAATSRPRPGSR